MERDEFAGLTIEEIKAREREDAQYRVDEVEFETFEIGAAGLKLQWNSGVTWYPSPEDVGDAAEWLADLQAPVTGRLYGGARLGDQSHGLEVLVDGEWREVFYRTPLEREAERVRWLADHDRHQRERFASECTKLDSRFRILPALFQRRIQERRVNNPNFRMEWESYEGFTCQQAARFAEQALLAVGAPLVELEPGQNTPDIHLCRRGPNRKDGEKPRHGWKRDGGYLAGEPYAEKAREWLEGWRMIGSKEVPGKDVDGRAEDWAGWEPLRQRKKPFDMQTQKNLMPGFKDEHSGNTFEAACRLAVLYLVHPEAVYRQHGVGAPIVGSEAYGDPMPAEATG